MRATFVMVATLSLFGCGEDPILTRAREEAAAASAAPGLPPQPAPAAGGVVTPGPSEGGPSGVPPSSAGGEPKPVQVPDPPPAPQGSPGGGKVGIPGTEGVGIPGSPPPSSGPSVQVSGTVIYDAWKQGEVRIDAFDGDHSIHGTHPGVIASTRIPKPGPFTISVPEGAGKLYIEAVVDENLDGRPGPQDPMGAAERYPVTVAKTAIGGVAIRLVKHEAPTDRKGDF